MKNLIKITWGNLIIILFVFYIIGDCYLSIKSGIRESIKSFNEYQAKIAEQEYHDSDEYKVSQIESHISILESDIEFNKTSIETMRKMTNLYSKKEIQDEQDKIDQNKRLIDSLRTELKKYSK